MIVFFVGVFMIIAPFIRRFVANKNEQPGVVSNDLKIEIVLGWLGNRLLSYKFDGSDIHVVFKACPGASWHIVANNTFRDVYNTLIDLYKSNVSFEKVVICAKASTESFSSSESRNIELVNLVYNYNDCEKLNPRNCDKVLNYASDGHIHVFLM